MVPRVLALFRSQIDALEGTPAVLPQARDLLTVLRLLSRCACHLQREGPGNEGASAVVSTTLQLAETWPVLRARVAWGDGPSAADRAGVQLYKVVAALAVVWLPGQGGEHEVVRQVWGSCLRSAASLARASSTIPPPVLTAGFEMLAVLTSMAVNMRELVSAPPFPRNITERRGKGEGKGWNIGRRQRYLRRGR